MIMYHNNNYNVVASPDEKQYLVINKVSEIVEYTEVSLPKAIIFARESDRVVEANQPKETDNVVDIGRKG